MGCHRLLGGGVGHLGKHRFPGVEGSKEFPVASLLLGRIQTFSHAFGEVPQGHVGVYGEVELSRGVALVRMGRCAVPVPRDAPPHGGDVRAGRHRREFLEDPGDRVGEPVAYADGDLLGAVWEVCFGGFHGYAAGDVDSCPHDNDLVAGAVEVYKAILVVAPG